MKVKDKKVMHFFIAIILDLLISVLIPAGNGLTDIGVRAIGARCCYCLPMDFCRHRLDKYTECSTVCCSRGDAVW